MRRKGLVTGTVARGDRRRVRNALTPAGRATAAALANWDEPLRQPLPSTLLRADCPEHQPAS